MVPKGRCQSDPDSPLIEWFNICNEVDTDDGKAAQPFGMFVVAIVQQPLWVMNFTFS